MLRRGAADDYDREEARGAPLGLVLEHSSPGRSAMALRRGVVAVAAVSVLVAGDPPFDFSRVTFSAAFSSSMVLQRAPAQAAVFGTAAPGATVTVQLAGPGGFAYTSPPAAVARSADPSRNGTWKVLLPARPAGLFYSLSAGCAGCANATPALLGDVAFGDVFLCSGQSNMECPVLTTVSRNESYAQCAAGAYDHVRVFQTGWRGLGLADNPAGASSWILPRVGAGPGCGAGCEPPNRQGGYAQRTWQLPRGPGASLERMSAACWYFGKSLSDLRRAADPAADPVPIGLISSTIGGTTIQEWLPPWATGNGTCADNNCGFVEQLSPDDPAQPSTTANCKNASLANVWSCPSGLCSALWFSMIAPFVNVTLAGAIWCAYYCCHRQHACAFSSVRATASSPLRIGCARVPPHSQIKASKTSSTAAARRRRGTSASRPRSLRRGGKPFPQRLARPRLICPLASSRLQAAQARARITGPTSRTLARRSGSPARTRGTGPLPAATL